MKKIMKKVGKFFLFHCLFPLMYKWYSRNQIEKRRVLFIEIRYAELTNNFTLLYEEFCKKETYSVDVAFLGNSVFSYMDYIRACIEMLKKLAAAEYVLVDESSNVLAAIPIRKETKIIQVWHGCGAFKRFGYEGMADINEKYYNEYYFTTVSSPEVVDIYAKSMGQPKEKILPIGVSRTDVFFDKQYVISCENEIRERYDIAGDKKVILYAPTFRGNVQDAKSPKLLDPAKLYDKLKERYVILYKGHPAVKDTPDIPAIYSRFFVDASKEKIETLMCAADMCITDYSSLIFEYALLERPMYFYAYDYKEYVTERGFYYNYNDFIPGEIYYYEEELAEGIIKGNGEISDKLVYFRKRFMSSCDGKSTSRIIDKMLAM